MEPHRPNPDELLAQVQAQGRQALRGRLKVFFGACAGVGKTFTMLEAARGPLAAGVDVVVGYVEPHAHPETMALLAGLETLPVRRVEYRGTTLTEFDLDAALARRPRLLLVDELAHTNATASRHAKRWQDVTELLEAGIDVYTTLNVQHIETLNDVVAQFSSVRVRETIPDTVFDQADEVELVDLPPDDLLQRLAEGKVYVSDRAAAAMRSFFQKANLVALRELALRRMAERVNVQAESYRHEGEVVPTSDRLLVCVGESPFSTRVVRAAARLAMTLRCPWMAVSVERSGPRMSQESQDRVWANLRLAGLLGAETATLSGQGVAREIVAYAQARHVTRIIVGKPGRGRWRGSPVYDLVRSGGAIDVHVISGDAGPTPAGRPAARGRTEWPWWSYLLAVVIVAVCMMVTFGLTNPLYWTALSVLAIMGVVVGVLAVRVRRQADTFRNREFRTLALYAMSRELATASTTDQVSALTRRHVGGALGGDVLLRLANPDGRLDGDAGAAMRPQDFAVAQWALEHNQPAGLGTDTLPACPILFAPLAPNIGVLGIKPHDHRPLTGDQLQLLTTLAALTAGALERIRLTDQRAGR